MQQSPISSSNDTSLWHLAEKIAEQGLLFTVLVGFIIGSYLRKIVWGWMVDERDKTIGKLETKIEKLEAENLQMLEIIRTNTKTTGDAVEGFNRALSELERLERQDKWNGINRRSSQGGGNS